MSVNFYENVDDGLLKFAVIMTKTNGKWVFCKHKLRDTWEVPGGHRVYSFGKIDSEIEKIIITDEMPANWTYPTIQPLLFEKVQEYLK